MRESKETLRADMCTICYYYNDYVKEGFDQISYHLLRKAERVFFKQVYAPLNLGQAGPLYERNWLPRGQAPEASAKG